MQVKVFETRSRGQLEQEVNAWLKEHPIGPDSMRSEFSTWKYEDTDQVHTFYVLILFYVPMHVV